MFQKKKIEGMLPSEIAAYVDNLHREIDALESQTEQLSKPDTFAVIEAGSQRDYTAEQELLNSLDLGEVVHVKSFKRFGESYAVKLSEHRVDRFPTKMEATHQAMLHGH